MNPGARLFESLYSQNIVLLPLLASSMLCRRWELWVERTGRKRRQTDTGVVKQGATMQMKIVPDLNICDFVLLISEFFTKLLGRFIFYYYNV